VGTLNAVLVGPTGPWFVLLGTTFLHGCTYISQDKAHWKLFWKPRSQVERWIFIESWSCGWKGSIITIHLVNELIKGGHFKIEQRASSHMTPIISAKLNNWYCNHFIAAILPLTTFPSCGPASTTPDGRLRLLLSMALKFTSKDQKRSYSNCGLSSGEPTLVTMHFIDLYWRRPSRTSIVGGFSPFPSIPKLKPKPFLLISYICSNPFMRQISNILLCSPISLTTQWSKLLQRLYTKASNPRYSWNLKVRLKDVWSASDDGIVRRHVL